MQYNANGFNPNNYNYNDNNNYNAQLANARNMEKRALNKNASMLGILLLVYNLANKVFLEIFYLLAYAYKKGSFTLSTTTAKNYLSTQKEFVQSSSFSMAGNLFIIGMSLVVILVIACAVMKIDFSEMFVPRKGHAKQAFKWFPLATTINIAVGMVIAIFTFYLNSAGVTVPEVDLSIRQPSTTAVILQVAYVVLFGPLAEEIIYRGIILTLLKPYGKFMAVFFSSLIFGVMHGNIAQAGSAFASGMVFGIIAIQCNSIVPTIIIHIINNFTASFLDLADIYSWPYSREIYMTFQICILMIGVYLLLIKLWQLKIKNDTNYALKSSQRYGVVMKNAFVICYFAYILWMYIDSFIYANK